MEDKNMIASDSMRQYLEDVDSYIRTSQVKRSESNIDEEQNHMFNFDDKPNTGLDFRQSSPGRNDFFKFSESRNSQLEESKEFSRKDEESKHTPSNVANEDWKSNVAEGITLNEKPESMNIDISLKKSEPGDEMKGILSNKERARRARLRKKKYYDDLEKRVEYLEEK